jgi:AcrR family transcriptional regulator
MPATKRISRPPRISVEEKPRIRSKLDKVAKPPPEQNPVNGRFVAGNSGGNGRPPGGRRELERELVAAVVRNFELYGEETIERVRQEDPATYLRVAAGLLPKELHVNVAHDLSIESFAERFKDLIARATGKPLALLEAAQSPTNNGVCETLDLKPNPEPIEGEDDD